jgi:hypothetical protein
MSARLDAAFVSWFLLLAGTGAGQTFEYPLQVGDQWIYRDDSGASAHWTVEARALEEFEGRLYTRLEGFPWGTVRLRQEPNGKLLAWNPDTLTEEPWVDFAAAEETEFPSVVDPCSPFGKIVSRAERYEGPVGSFTDAVLVKYGPNACADAGVLEEFYVPSVGLAHRAYLTIAGPRSLDLVYARLGGRTYLSEASISLTLALDRGRYTVDRVGEPQAPVMTARLTLRNEHEDPVTLRFPTGQTYDLVIRNDSGAVVCRWSEGMVFTEAEQIVEVSKGEKNHVISVRLAETSGGGAPLPGGSYVAEAWLATSAPRTYRTSMSFEIQ